MITDIHTTPDPGNTGPLNTQEPRIEQRLANIEQRLIDLERKIEAALLRLDVD